MSCIRGVLFDLDGTLLDSAPDLVASLNHVRESEGLDALPVSELSSYASRGALGLLAAGMPATDELMLESWRQRFLAYYALNSHCHTRPYDGISEMLEFLVNSGIPWGIVTNKVESLTLPIVEAQGWMKSAACVVCGDTLSRAKPHPDPVLLACSMMDLEPGHVLFVGDDVRDVEAGLAAGTQTAAVHYGYGSYEFASSEASAHMHVHNPVELVGLIRELNRQSVVCGAIND